MQEKSVLKLVILVRIRIIAKVFQNSSSYRLHLYRLHLNLVRGDVEILQKQENETMNETLVLKRCMANKMERFNDRFRDTVAIANLEKSHSIRYKPWKAEGSETSDQTPIRFLFDSN